MKVHIDYMDGHYSMRQGRPDAEAAAIEIPDEEWLAYKAYVGQIRHWNDRIAELESSEEYQRQHREAWERWERATRP